MTAMCPSHEWDRYINEQDEAAEAEMQFFRTYRSTIAAVAAGICANPNFLTLPTYKPEDRALATKTVVDLAASIVLSIVEGGGEE